MDEDATLASPASLKHRIRQSLCFCCCCCFRRGHVHLQSPSPVPSDGSPAMVWIETKGSHERSLLEIKEKCLAMLGLRAARYKRHSSAEFRYDPLSYALNFEDGFDYDDDAPLRNFSARLPPRKAQPVSAAIG